MEIINRPIFALLLFSHHRGHRGHRDLFRFFAKSFFKMFVKEGFNLIFFLYYKNCFFRGGPIQGENLRVDRWMYFRFLKEHDLLLCLVKLCGCTHYLKRKRKVCSRFHSKSKLMIFKL